MYLDKLLREQEGIQFQRDAAFRALVKNMKAVADSDYAVPSSLGAVLRNYQKTGFRWLKTMEAAGFGGILADDMGWAKPCKSSPCFWTPARTGTIAPPWWSVPPP